MSNEQQQPGIVHSPTAEDASEYPILTSERLLGARVTVSQRDTLRHEYQGRTTRESAVEVHGVDADPYLDQRDRKYIAAWARRVLFGGDRDGN